MMPAAIRSLLACLALVACGSLPQAFGAGAEAGAGRVVEVEYPPSEKPGELVYGVIYRAWIPDGVTRLRGLIVHQHGCGKGACQGGETAADDLHWQALARKWDCALVGPSYRQEDGQNCRLWCDPRNGSRTRFLQGLDDLAAKSGHPELATVPWCLWGHSGGGFWASLMMASDPDRIIAAWLRSGTAYGAWEKGEVARPEIVEATYRIPVVCNPGAKEQGDKRFSGAWTGTLGMFRAFRKHDAPIAFAPDPRTAHECGDSRYLAIPFFDACLAMRLPDPGSDPTRLKPVDRARSWLAPLLGDSAEPAATYEGPLLDTVWLPDERVAEAWMEYVRTGGVDDPTPPSPPRHLQAHAGADRAVTLTWEAAADPESGIREFIIERDGREVGRVPEKAAGRFGKPLFQRMSYHDTPEKPLAAMRFVDPAPPTDRTPEYRVVTVNAAGLRSSPSAPAARP